LCSLHGVIGRCSHRAVPARDRPHFWLEFIKKLRREMSGLAV
jgi:hypothetical protein